MPRDIRTTLNEQLHLAPIGFFHRVEGFTYKSTNGGTVVFAKQAFFPLVISSFEQQFDRFAGILEAHFKVAAFVAFHQLVVGMENGSSSGTIYSQSKIEDFLNRAAVATQPAQYELSKIISALIFDTFVSGTPTILPPTL